MRPGERDRLMRKMKRAISHFRNAAYTANPHVQVDRLERLFFELDDIELVAQSILVRMKKELHEVRGR